ncbi:MAG TPA: DUF2891 family protein [Streptosporangiaceae bacterium]|nr:DUF2891 family protein [Streptosporangiaceae bacterium]
MIPLDDAALESLATTALAAVRREYPHFLIQELNSDADLLPPRQLNPAFYGCYDWHSAVHSHWTLVRALDRGLPDALATAVGAVLDEHLGADRLAAETAFYAGPGGLTAERPYGWAWLLLLHAECQALGGDRHRRWAEALAPLATLLSGRLEAYFGGELAFPIRSGTHGNTAFSLGLAIEAARRRGDGAAAAAFTGAAQRMFGAEQRLRWDEDPSGDAFLTAELTEAALMADILTPADFTAWLDRVLPDPAAVAWAPPGFHPDAADPGTVHLEGLLVTRAWCLDAVGRALPPGHPAAAAALAAADAHRDKVAGLRPAEGFGRSHWLPTFLLYLDARLRR